MKKFSSLVVAAAILAGTSAFAAGNMTLEAVKGAPTSMDASDGAWAKAKGLKIVVDQQPYKSSTYKNITTSNVELKSLYDAENVYFRVQYDDPTKSLERQPWIKQADGSWKMKKNQDQNGGENNYYEDKFGMFWNINTKGFDKKGCAIACHIAKDGMTNGIADKAPGRKYTNNPGETIDMWHWMSVRSEPTGYNTDQYVDNTSNGDSNKNWGRKGDELTSGGFKDNVNKEKTAPLFMSKAKEHKEFWIQDADKVPFVDTYKAGDMIPSMIVAPAVGSRGDVASKAKWENGKWTIVFKRALVTKHPKSAEQDVQFSDLKKEYSFGVAVFDNAALNHLYHEGVLKLSFK